MREEVDAVVSEFVQFRRSHSGAMRRWAAQRISPRLRRSRLFFDGLPCGLRVSPIHDIEGVSRPVDP